MKRSVFPSFRLSALLVLLLAIASIGCDETTAPKKPPVVMPPADTLYSFSLKTTTMRTLRTNEAYAIWMRYRGDSVWHFETNFRTTYNGAPDSSAFYGYFASHYSLDSVAELAVSVENLHDSSTPTAFLMQSTVSGKKDSIQATFACFDSVTMAGFRALTANVIFKSGTSDSNRANHEFYIADSAAGGLKSSMASLPPAPTGWTYAVWVIDSNFSPHHYFLYGIFTHSAGHDLDSANDKYPFPGGYRQSNLNVLGAVIQVTLEPLWTVPTLRSAGPSVFSILEYRLPRFISNGMVEPMTNVSRTSLVSGRIIVRR